MKRIVTLCLAVLMLFSAGTSAFAATITESNNQSANMTVVYGVDTAYTVTIPETITLGADGTGTAEYTVSDALIPAGEHLYLTTDSVNRVEDVFYLTNVDESSVKIPYEITTVGADIWDDNIHTRTMVFDQAELMVGDVSRSVTFSLLEAGVYSGTYTDVLTTTVAVGYALYGARQFPEDYTQIVWPEEYTLWDVNVWNSKTYEWGDQLRLEWYTGVPNLWTKYQGEWQTGLVDGHYWGLFERDRVLYFGEELQCVTKDLYDFIMTNTTPVNFFDFYIATPNSVQMNKTLNFQMLAEFDNDQAELDITMNAGSITNIILTRSTSEGIPFVFVGATDAGYAILYVDGIGWVEPYVFEDAELADPAALIAKLTPTDAAPTLEFNGDCHDRIFLDWVLENGTVID